MAETIRPEGSKIQTVAKREGKYPTFSLGGEEYGVRILKAKGDHFIFPSFCQIPLEKPRCFMKQ